MTLAELPCLDLIGDCFYLLNVLALALYFDDWFERLGGATGLARSFSDDFLVFYFEEGLSLRLLAEFDLFERLILRKSSGGATKLSLLSLLSIESLALPGPEIFIDTLDGYSLLLSI